MEGKLEIRDFGGNWDAIAEYLNDLSCPVSMWVSPACKARKISALELEAEETIYYLQIPAWAAGLLKRLRPDRFVVM